MSAMDVTEGKATEPLAHTGSFIGGSKKISTLSLGANMVLSITGSCVLGIGAQMKGTGWIVAPLLLVVGCIMLSEMVWVVSVTIDKLSDEKGITVKAYQDFVEGALGIWGRRVSNITSTLALLGMICNGLVLIAANLHEAAPILKDDEKGDKKLWALLMTSTTVVYSFVDIGHLLHKSGLVGPVLTVICMLTVWTGCINAYNQKLDTFEPDCKDGVDEPYTSVGINDAGGGFFDDVLNVTQIGSYMVFVYAIVVTLPTLKSTMAEPRRVVPMTVTAFFLVAAMFLSIMLLFYISFGNLGPNNILTGFTHDHPPAWWATNRPWETGQSTVVGKVLAWSMTIHLLCSDAIYVPCTVVAVEAWAPKLFETNRVAWFAIRVFIILFRLAVATEVTAFIALTALISSAFCICNNILLPLISFYVAGPMEKAGVLRRAWHLFIFIFGLVFAVLGIYGAIKNLVESSADPIPAGSMLREGITDACLRACKREHAAVCSSPEHAAATTEQWWHRHQMLLT